MPASPDFGIRPRRRVVPASVVTNDRLAGIKACRKKEGFLSVSKTGPVQHAPSSRSENYPKFVRTDEILPKERAVKKPMIEEEDLVRRSII